MMETSILCLQRQNERVIALSYSKYKWISVVWAETGVTWVCVFKQLTPTTAVQKFSNGIESRENAVGKGCS